MHLLHLFKTKPRNITADYLNNATRYYKKQYNLDIDDFTLRILIEHWENNWKDYKTVMKKAKSKKKWIFYK